MKMVSKSKQSSDNSDVHRGPEASLEGCQGCQLTPLEFWKLAQANPNISPSVSQKSD